MQAKKELKTICCHLIFPQGTEYEFISLYRCARRGKVSTIRIGHGFHRVKGDLSK